MYAEWVIMLAAAAIAARLTRLTTRDVITNPIRRRIGGRFDGTAPEDTTGPVETFFACAWCIGWWITAATYATVYLIWPGAVWTVDQVIAWAAAAAATNLVYASFASATARLQELTEAAELRLYANRRENL